MMGFSNSANAEMHHGILRQGTIHAVPLHGHMGRGLLSKIF